MSPKGLKSVMKAILICELEGAESGAGVGETVTEASNQSAPAEPVAAEVSGASQLVSVPDTGSADGVTVIEIAVSVGDSVAEGDTLIVLESDKASMEIPAPASGVVTALKVSEGKQVVQGDPICEMTGGDANATSTPTPQASSEPAAVETLAPQSSGGIEKVVVPDTGNADGVTVIEVSIGVGDTVSEGDTLIVLESDKASMEIPSPVSGKVLALSVKEGDTVAQGDAVADVEATGGSQTQTTTASTQQPAATPASTKAPAPQPPVVDDSECSFSRLKRACGTSRACARARTRCQFVECSVDRAAWENHQR